MCFGLIGSVFAPYLHEIVLEGPLGCALPPHGAAFAGERKRVHLGIELLHQPRLIFADEPTTGPLI